MTAETSQTLDRGLRVLKLLADTDHGLTVTELSHKLGVNRTVVYRLLATLEQHALVRRDLGGRARVGLGVLIGSLRSVRAFLEPVLEFLRAIPPPVLVPILILFAGIGDTMKVFVVVSGCIWPILLNTVEGVRAIDEVLADTSRCYRISGVARLRHLVLRSASPQIMTGLRQALSVGIILMVISEMFAASNGLGFTIIQFQRSFAIKEMWSGVILLGLLGFVLALVMRVFERRVLFWYFGLRRSQRGGS